MLFFLNKRTPLEWEMGITQQILNIWSPLSPGATTHVKSPSAFWIYGEACEEIIFKKSLAQDWGNKYLQNNSLAPRSGS